MPGKRMLRASWSLLLIVAAVALHGSPGGAQLASSDAATDFAMPAVFGNPIAQLPLDSLSDTRNRPLFSQSRRPPAPAPPDRPAMARVEHAPPQQPTLSPPGVALYGIVVGAQGARAFIATGAAERIIGVRPGDDVSGWMVSAITERRLVLSRADRSATFTLFSVANAGQIERSDAKASSRPASRTADPPRGRVRVR
jgi:general secretion pathway protein N